MGFFKKIDPELEAYYVLRQGCVSASSLKEEILSDERLTWLQKNSLIKRFF